MQEGPDVLRGRDVQELDELKRQGLSVRTISRLTGYDRKTIRKYLLQPETRSVYVPRPAPPSKLDLFKQYLEERLQAGVWNARVLLRELRARGYTGGYTMNGCRWSHGPSIAGPRTPSSVRPCRGTTTSMSSGGTVACPFAVIFSVVRASATSARRVTRTTWSSFEAHAKKI